MSFIDETNLNKYPSFLKKCVSFLNHYVSLELACLILIVGIIGVVFVVIISLFLLSKYMKNRSSFDETNLSICPKCGATIVEGNKFCTKCGTKIKNA